MHHRDCGPQFSSPDFSNVGVVKSSAHARVVVVGVVAVACGLSSACQNPFLPSYCNDPSTLIEPTDAPNGEFAIGVVERTIRSSKDESGDVAGVVNRSVTAWYPSDDGADDATASFCYDGYYSGHARAGLSSSCESPRPVVLYSHGSGGLRWLATYMTEFLASHGFVVAAPDHALNTNFDKNISSEAFIDVTLRRPVDIQDTFDWLVAESADEESPLFGCVDERAGYAVIGHSFGGFTALALGGWELTVPGRDRVNLGDGRVWAVMTHAPWDADGTLLPGNDTFSVPLLTLAGEVDVTTTWDNVSALHSSVNTSPSTLGLLPDGGHYSFIPATCLILEDGDGCGNDFLDGNDVAGLINRSALLFLDEVRGVNAAGPLSIVDDALVWNPAPPE